MREIGLVEWGKKCFRMYVNIVRWVHKGLESERGLYYTLLLERDSSPIEYLSLERFISLCDKAAGIRLQIPNDLSRTLQL